MSAEREQRIDELFLEAIELPRDEVEAFLTRECGSDDALRDEVSSLVAHHRRDTLIDASGTGSSVGRERRRLVGPGRDSGSSSSQGILRASTKAPWAAAALAVAFAVAGVLTYRSVRTTLRDEIEARLETALGAGIAAHHTWIEGWKRELELWARDEEVLEHVQELVAVAAGRDLSGSELHALPVHQVLEAVLEPLTADESVRDVLVIGRENYLIFLGGMNGDGVYRLNAQGARLTAPLFLGENVVTPPFVAGANIGATNDTDLHRSPIFIVLGTPCFDKDGNVIAALVIRLLAQKPLSENLHVAHQSGGGEIFAFDARGVLASATRYDDELKTLGLIPDEEGARAAMVLELRDPGGDLSAGFTPEGRPVEWSFTQMAALATSGESGSDLDGYRDVRGRRVVGAWRWLPEYSIGVAFEIPYEEAYAGLRRIQLGFGSLVGLLVLFAGYGFVSTRTVEKLESEVVRARKLGQYRLEELIGEGGMAQVYRARHAMLQRPTAIKLLKSDAVGPDDVARFEREVQLVSQLTHPNTIQIFDYGQAVDGTLFYVMEFIPGMSLRELVDASGPPPPGRAIAILRQVCGSLREAHGLGIVHRDIKPRNVMVCNRPSRADVVKVLDFGLARTVERASSRITGETVLGGTPVYIAPERIREPANVDARSDIYSLGAMAYWLLTGKEIVEGDSPHEVLLKTMHADPPAPSTLAHDLPAELDALVIQCLARDPDQRPQTVADIDEALKVLAGLYPWSQEEARACWQDYQADGAG